MDYCKDGTHPIPSSSLLSLEDVNKRTHKHHAHMKQKSSLPILSTYQKLSCICILANLVASGVQVAQHDSDALESLQTKAATAFSINFCVSIAIRNEHVINSIFWIICSIPHGAPLSLRRRAAKVYCHGGIHSGCAISGAFWYITFTGLFFLKSSATGTVEYGLVFIAGIALVLLTIIFVYSYPSLRARFHNEFEMTHRFLGWGLIVLLWIQVLLMILVDPVRITENLGLRLTRSPPFWLLICATLFLFYPWTRLRLRPVVAESLSNHVLRLNFIDMGEKPCMTRRLATVPLKDTHAFATVPNTDGKGYSIYISNAGDWTKHLIDNPPEKIWTKGGPVSGATHAAKLFRKVLFVATGAAVAPVLSAMQSRPVGTTALLWVTAKPQSTYDTAFLQQLELYWENVKIIDRSKVHIEKDKILALANALHYEVQSEAVFIISNQPLTTFLGAGLEAADVPVFGPIFDS